MTTAHSDTSQFVSRVKRIPLASIRPNDHNPRGKITKNDSFLRLVSSISKVGVLVPIVVRELPRSVDGKQYELVDGERLFLAAQEAAQTDVPAHILDAGNTLGNLRKLMFHLHMTRDQWSPLAQCKSLSEAYPELANGLRFSDRAKWIDKLSEETVMERNTARDRIHVLSWAKNLKTEIYSFDDRRRDKDIYSYVLAIEASIVLPSLDAFRQYYNHDKPPEPTANTRARSCILTCFKKIAEPLRDRTRLRNTEFLSLLRLILPPTLLVQKCVCVRSQSNTGRRKSLKSRAPSAG